MKNKFFILFLFTIFGLYADAQNLFFYSPENGVGGLRFAYEEKNGEWKSIGNGYDFVKSDFGPWGSHKKMWDPQLFRKTDGGWILMFRATSDGGVIGVAETNDFTSWRPQKYMTPADTSKLSYRSRGSFVPSSALIGGVEVKGYIMKTDVHQISDLKKYAAERERLAKLYSEHCDGDSARFATLKPLKATLVANGNSKDISPLLMGIFFEDINYSADGGLYAELIQNRDFEYVDNEGRDEGWGPRYPWTVTGDNINFTIETENPIHHNNPHYARLEIKNGISALVNKENAFINPGFDGISVSKGENYRLRLKSRSDKKIPLEINLLNENGRKVASGKIKINSSNEWSDYEIILTATEHSPKSLLQIVPKGNGILDLDMVSLFPVKTFKGRENGMRPDLSKALADLKPRFVRFPGGCVAHGNGIDNIYDWKGSIGKLEERKPLANIWRYHQTRGLGYHEYFQFCEDIGSEPLPVLAAGVPCQNSGWPSHHSHDDLTRFGQQGGIPMDSLDSYIQDILDLIEYANGPSDSEWGAKRAAAGHPEPFNLKYIGIGNEDMITEIFEERFTKINSAVKKAHPEINVVGTVGPFYEGSDYDEGWRLAREHKLDLVDEHYYVDPAWLIYNQNYYDNYDRSGTKVYLGEWAAHLPGRPSNIETALAEALYLTSVERNGDVVSMSSYAPLLAKEGHIQWRPDLIYFNNTEVKPTTDYETMRLFGQNAGQKYFDGNLEIDTDNEKAAVRIGSSIVKDESTGDFILKMVNMLPVDVEVQADLRNLFNEDKGLKTMMTIMKGAPADKKASIQTTRMSSPSSLFTLPLSPYSLTVVRILSK